MKKFALATDIQIGDEIYIANLKRYVVVLSIRIKDHFKYEDLKFICVTHKDGEAKFKFYTQVRFAQGKPQIDDMAVEKARVRRRLRDYEKMTRRYKHGSDICPCGNIIPNYSACSHCEFVSYPQPDFVTEKPSDIIMKTT